MLGNDHAFTAEQIEARMKQIQTAGFNAFRNYQVELYFMKPWYGIGGGMDCTGWRLFDVAINGEVVLRNIDIWKEAGALIAIKKVIPVSVTNRSIHISFPRVASYQAVICAIAIRSETDVGN